MVINLMREFEVSLKEHYWSQKCCVDVHNISSSKNINRRFPLEINEEHTQDISELRFHLWETIWHLKKYKTP